ncbi:MAG: PQQ-dependent sugar dehydrogenase [Pedobacter sp.]|nr:PQQ-dependent sugar dehydrogenase [Chitinophagaceae bacterium]
MSYKMKKYLTGLFILAVSQTFANYNNGDTLKTNNSKQIVADADNAGLKLPKGFAALKVADNVGRARHISITPQGSVYVKSSKLVDGKGILELKDIKGDGKAEIVKTFGNFTGTGITVKNGYLYACSDEQVFRYKLDANNEVINADAPEIVITGLLNKHQHENKTVALDNNGNIYVNIGAYSNSCQEKDRTNGSKGKMPCPILDSAGGIWMFKANKLNQTYADGIRYATGLRNVVGLDWNTQTNSLFVMQHGRDQLYQNWPQFYDSIASAELPSECMFELKQGSNCGWPYTYYNHMLHSKMVAPEYGGDGKKVSNDPKFQDPVVAFPGHMAPNDILFYTGNQFPERYKNGAFIAFHGSWNRAPLPQKGYFVVFQPFKNGKPNGDWEVFADGFSGIEVVTSTRSAQHRPCGLAQAPDGSLYVSDDNKGTIYRIMYSGK